ncbi:MAG: DNA polymerase/3'-5' exonuclease PolX [Patescibacteria group bacterium]|nr:DNA polymerase/3'-5' exonuclease PolX [Patescibacteria group bacterium]
MENQKIAKIFSETSDILEILGDSRFKIRAYRQASQTIETYPYHLRDIYEDDPKKLDDIPGIGKALMGKIIEIFETGDCRKHVDLVRKIKPGVLDILRLRGIGPKKTKLFLDELGIDSVVKLKDAAKRGLLRELPGMGEKSEDDVLLAIESYGRLTARMPMYQALSIAEGIIDYLKVNKKVKKATYAGSLRRRLETIGDIDILACGSPKIIGDFCDMPGVAHVEAKGDTKATVILESGIQVDLRVVPEESFGAALYYFTGSKAHNIATRKIAQKKGMKINEYGVFKGKKSVAGKTEDEIFKKIGLPYIIPEMREDTGEIEFMKKNPRFKPLEESDIQGDLHSHTDWSDGKSSLAEMAEAAQARGYKYLAITDHSQSVKVAHGMEVPRLEKQLLEIDKLNKGFKGFRLLKGCEVDILKDGSLDMPDSILEKLDIVVASVHTYFQLPEKEQTTRIIKAIQNPFVTLLAHPTGKLTGMREAYDVDLLKVMRAAKKAQVAIELNCNPFRLDLDTKHLRAARDMGVMVSLGTDSHSASHLEFIEYGIAMAHRGWLQPENILNCQKCIDFIRKNH